MKKSNRHNSVEQMLHDLQDGNFSLFSEDFLPESYLQKLANHAQSEDRFGKIVRLLMSALSENHSREFDWNCGSLIQHAPTDIVFSNIPFEGPKRLALFESIGLTWCLGEFGRRDQRVVGFLEDVIANAKSSESWWRAAYALEKLGLVNAVSYLKSALRSSGLPKLETCLSDLGNERFRIGILLHSKLENLHNQIFPKVKKILCNINSSPPDICLAGHSADHSRLIETR